MSSRPPEPTKVVDTNTNLYVDYRIEDKARIVIPFLFPSVRAHRLILAGVSPVFRRMFLSSSSETMFTKEDEEIQITDSECFAFQNMINFIYSKDFTCGADIRDSFETLKIGDKYDLADLVIQSRRAIENHVISTRNVGKVLRVIHTYEYVNLNIISPNYIKRFLKRSLEGFGSICEDLSDRCRKFIGENLRTAQVFRSKSCFYCQVVYIIIFHYQDVFNLLATASEDDDELERGFETELLVKLLRETAVCRNCKMHPTDCLNGQKVTYDNMITGKYHSWHHNKRFYKISEFRGQTEDPSKLDIPVPEQLEHPGEDNWSYIHLL